MAFRPLENPSRTRGLHVAFLLGPLQVLFITKAYIFQGISCVNCLQPIQNLQISVQSPALSFTSHQAISLILFSLNLFLCRIENRSTLIAQPTAEGQMRATYHMSEYLKVIR